MPDAILLGSGLALVIGLFWLFETKRVFLYPASYKFERTDIEVGTHSSLKARVPSDKLESVMNDIAALGKEKERSISAVDVTDDKIDLEAKIKNLTAFRDRLRALVGQGKTVKEIMELEEQLNRVQTELDSVQGRLVKLKLEVALSSLTVGYGPKKILGPLGYVAYGLYWTFEKLFVIQ
jgi:hypothetical protein